MTWEKVNCRWTDSIIIIYMGGKYGILSLGKGDLFRKTLLLSREFSFTGSSRRVCFEEIVIPFGEFILMKRLVLLNNLIPKTSFLNIYFERITILFFFSFF